jgi:hypothetical protein
MSPVTATETDLLAEIVKYDLKIYAHEDSEAEAGDLIPVFHRWIAGEELPELLIDVADYRHVHHGPGVLLVGHDAQYGFDLGEGRPGLLYSRRRETAEGVRNLPGTGARLRSVLRRALAACRKLEAEPELSGRLRFRGDELQLSVNDRLLPREEAGEALRPFLEELAAEAFPGREVTLEEIDGPGERLGFSLRAAAPSKPEKNQLGALLERLV